MLWIITTDHRLLGISPLRSDWIDGSCTISHTNHSRINVLSAFITDMILLVLMLIGLTRWKNASSSSGVWRLLRTQVTVTHLPPLLVIALTPIIVFNMGCSRHLRRSPSNCTVYLESEPGISD